VTLKKINISQLSNIAETATEKRIGQIYSLFKYKGYESRSLSPFIKKNRFPQLKDDNTENEDLKKSIETLKNATIQK
jgi:hypothetical protein